MAVTSDLMTQDEQGTIRLHPYLVALVRWCVSCLWSTANIVVHRLLMTPHLPINVSRPQKPRAASTDHLHPEPKVECVVLHTPNEHKLDVIFVHGLYGSLGNTWRQGDWRPKYKMEPNKIPLIDPTSSCECQKNTEHYTKTNHFESNIHDESVNLYDNYESNVKILPNDDVFITENFYNNALLDQVEIVDNYELQANFVRDLFKKECDNYNYDVKNDVDTSPKLYNDCECKLNVRRCEVGCGCVCDECYSSCWPRDWIKVDYPEARVISINYTSDPYLWRPLWVKESKRLRLHERAEQMTRQLLALGVGERPIVWVGHSKGGLFIKQIYCEAYEAHLKLTTPLTKSEIPQNLNEQNVENEKENNIIREHCNNSNVIANSDNICDKESAKNINGEERLEETSSDRQEDVCPSLRSGLWRNSRGFMFYSVPHRGSPLADIKTPITARSIELLEISKDCALVLSLQERWLQATSPLRPAVRSLVETTRTLMSVLWLRIVSVTSADAGIGALYGVSLDHREICKPSSRYCLLYTELMNLMKTALNKCRCQ
ncbi:uncharacterized protein LOC106138972 [Amyelois transitella]|uniref:uncharacterized protein LOC106138972 n=1 Tax=Amyelois transitella TaxID=680683 RepID=UPI0029903DD1|nr:uncharacterized protein LOC106138972 [Amyelois transitella]